MRKVNWKDDELIKKVCAESKSYSDVCRFFGLRSESNIRTVKRYVEKYKIDISHFKRPNMYPVQKEKKSLDEILIEHSDFTRSHLKERLFKAGLIENKCDKCGQNGTWNEQPLNMQLDHINGIYDDNRIHNLRMLCPNCHSQTPTYGSKNRKAHK